MSIPSFGIDIRKLGIHIRNLETLIRNLRTEICFAGGGYFQYPSKILIFEPLETAEVDTSTGEIML